MNGRYLSRWMFILYLVALRQLDERQITTAPHRVQLRPRALLKSSTFTLYERGEIRSKEEAKISLQ